MSSTKYTSRPITNKIPKDLSESNFKVQKIEKVNGNVVYANFDKKVH